MALWLGCNGWRAQGGESIQLRFQTEHVHQHQRRVPHQLPRRPQHLASEHFEENFDEVIPPALPPGWSSGPGCWTTSSVDPDTSPNDAFVPDIDGISDCALDLTVSLPADPAVLTFRNNFNTEFSDGVCGTTASLKFPLPISAGAISWTSPTRACRRQNRCRKLYV